MWEWSHSAEAYDNALKNLQDKPRDWLEVCFAEWAADVDGEFVEGLYFDALNYARETPDDELVESIWAQASELAQCDNGGHNAYVCPDGCHTVSFSRKGQSNGN